MSETDNETTAAQAQHPVTIDEPEEGVTYGITLDELFYELSNGAVGTAPPPLLSRRLGRIVSEEGEDNER